MAISFNFRRAVWLATCLVLALACHHSRVGLASQLEATSIFEPGNLGITFQDADTPEDGTFRGPKLQLVNRGAFAVPSADGAQLERNRQLQEGGPRITGGQFLRPRSQATSKELLRRRHIAELLNALADNIPKQKKQEPKRQPQQQQLPVAVSAQRASAEMPIYRNSRTFPSAGANYRQGTDSLLAIGWPVDGSGQVVGGRGTAGGNLRESRKANFATTGIVWGATADGQPILQRVWPSASHGGAGSATPPFYSQHTANAAAASTKSARARARPAGPTSLSPSSNGELAQLTANSLDGSPEPVRQQQQQQQQQQQHQRQHSRSGNEEVPLHTPEHASSSSDYEWKRVENSRNSWNNLRGMWGKRSPPQPTSGDDGGETRDDESNSNNQESEQERNLWLLASANSA